MGLERIQDRRLGNTAQLWLWQERKQICTLLARAQPVLSTPQSSDKLRRDPCWRGEVELSFFLSHCFLGLLRSTDCLWLSLGPCVCQSHLPADDPKASVIYWMVNAEAYQTYMVYSLIFPYCHLLAQWSSFPSYGYPSALAQGVSITFCFLSFLPFLFFFVYMYVCTHVWMCVG